MWLEDMRVPAAVHARLQSEKGCWTTSILQELRLLSLRLAFLVSFFLGQFALINLARIRLLHWNFWKVFMVVMKPDDLRGILTCDCSFRRWLNIQRDLFSFSIGWDWNCQGFVSNISRFHETSRSRLMHRYYLFQLAMLFAFKHQVETSGWFQ